METAPFRSGFVTLLGRPNAGKSTLINAVVGKKIAITSDTAQTTRHRFRAVHTTPDYQLVLVDTPGVHKPHDALGDALNESAAQALDGIDAVAFLVDASKPYGRGDEWVAKMVQQTKAAHILVISKIDLANRAAIDRQIEAASQAGSWDAVVELSAKTGEGVSTFLDTVAGLLPEGPQWFPADMDTDQPTEVIVAEFIREKILRSFREEIPHAIGVICDELEYDKKKDLERVFATIYVERESQKGMIIGKGGRALKRVGTEARIDLEQLLGCRVFLDLHVKVRKNWRRDLTQIERFGYGEGA
ncbi:GTPase Era [Hugonella massiliensis]|uniref:GTPase Era n=1 Tax=Hugonella massiliensis TaxID=1720315 RepID=UPI00073E7513|nr:GTPase Era [Hugonella massiliensis]